MIREQSMGRSSGECGFWSATCAGILLALVGVALISLSAVDAPASATVSDERDKVLHGSNETDVLSGGPGDDEIYGGAGRDLLLGGRGSDFIEAKDGEADYVACGAGDDTASIDDDDYADSDCETVYPE